MVYNAANSQQSNTYQYPTDKKVRKLFEVPTYLAQFFLEWEMFQTKFVEKIKTHILSSIFFSPKNLPFMR